MSEIGSFSDDFGQLAGASLMGGYRYGAATKVEHVHSFDVRAIVRAIRGGPRALRHPSDAYLRAEGLTLHVGGRSTVGAAATLDGPAESGSLRLAWSNVGREGQHTQRIALDGQRRPFGGLRRWALCPGCARRVAALRAKLGASGPLVGYLVPPKPEGMHWPDLSADGGADPGGRAAVG